MAKGGLVFMDDLNCISSTKSIERMLKTSKVDRLSLNDMTIGDLKSVVAAIAENHYKEMRISKIVDFVMYSIFFVCGVILLTLIIYNMIF